MAEQESPYHGLLIIDKPGRPLDPTSAPAATPTAAQPALPTSHDVVQKVRRWSQQRRIGHTGTLDPLASGVLVLCLGNATRLVEYYQGHNKQYYAEIVLGATTDTYDALGAVTSTAAVPALNLQQIDDVLRQFRGDVLQSPPAYSALKQGGESAHYKARRGETVVLEPRPVTFYQIELLDWRAPDRLCLRVVCSAGAYIRSLAYDIGQALGPGAYLDGLRREAAGAFTLAQAHPLTTVEAAAQQGTFADLLLPLGYGLELPTIGLTTALAQRFSFGQKVVLDRAPALAARANAQLACAVDEAGRFVGLLCCLGPAAGSAHGYVWKAEKWFIE